VPASDDRAGDLLVLTNCKNAEISKNHNAYPEKSPLTPIGNY
jgi:hypothetical protein